MDGLIEGRIVHYVNANGEHRAAIVVFVGNAEEGAVDLCQFAAYHDAERGGAGLHDTFTRVNVPYSETPRPHTWHWIERA